MANTRRRTQRANRTAARTAIARQPGAAAATLESEDVRMGRTIDWQSENKYITTDLRQLLIVSIILFVLLFVVGFLLN
jgi:hypothetical protein